MHINDLPPELLVLIFSKIDDFSQKIRLAFVCRVWRQIVPLDWKITKACPKPLTGRDNLHVVLNRCGEWLEELWLLNIEIDEKLVRQMAMQMKCLKDLKLSKCQLDGLAMHSISNLFGQQLYSFILDETDFHPKTLRFIENNFPKLEHLNISLNDDYTLRTLPTKLPKNLRSLSLRITRNSTQGISTLILLLKSATYKNLKILHLELRKITTNAILAIAKIKSLVYLNLPVKSARYQLFLKQIICNKLPNLKAINLGQEFCSEELVLDICQARPDLVHFNVSTVIIEQAFQIPDSLNSLALHSPSTDEHLRLLLLRTLLFQNNKSIQHLDIRSFTLPSPNYLLKLLGRFPDLKSIHCKLPNFDLAIFFHLIEKRLENGRNFKIYFHFVDQDSDSDNAYYKYILPEDLPQFNAGWRAKMCSGKCENLVLKKVIKKAIDGGNEPSFLDEYWME